MEITCSKELVSCNFVYVKESMVQDRAVVLKCGPGTLRGGEVVPRASSGDSESKLFSH